MITHVTHRADGTAATHVGAVEGCGICTELARKGRLAYVTQPAATGGQDPAADEAQEAGYQGADAEVYRVVKGFGDTLLNIGFTPGDVVKIVELLPQPIAQAGAAYRSELHGKVLDLLGYLGGKLMEDFLPEAGELDTDSAYDVGFQSGVAFAFLVAQSGSKGAMTLTDSGNYKAVRSKALEAAAQGNLRDVLLEPETETKDEE